MPADAPVIYVPMNTRLYYFQALLQDGAEISQGSGTAAHILYDYTRGKDLTADNGFLFSAGKTLKTQEINNRIS